MGSLSFIEDGCRSGIKLQCASYDDKVRFTLGAKL